MKDISGKVVVKGRRGTYVGNPDFRGNSARSLVSNVYDIMSRRAVAVALLAGVGAGVGPFLGTKRPRIRAMHAAMKETEMVCTWRSARLPRIMDLRTSGSSNSPTFAAVLNRAERFISRFPFRLRTTGIIMMSWSTCCMASQCYAARPLVLSDKDEEQ